MKKAIRSFVSFTRTERMGLVALCALLVILLAIRLTMHLWVQPVLPSDREQRLIAAWDSFKHKQSLIKDTAGRNTSIYKEDYDDDGAPLPATIDVNAADSGLFVRLRGIGPVTAHRIMEWRRNKGNFTTIEEFYQAAAMPEPVRELLANHVLIGKTADK